jgi:AraC-like DNA-binding protein
MTRARAGPPTLRRMATPLPLAHAFDEALIPSGTLWLPRASLTACMRGTMVRNTLGADLSDAQRINHFPASPLCSLSWWFTGHSVTLEPAQPGQMGTLSDPQRPLPGTWVLGGPQTRPVSSWCPGPVHGMMVMFMPDALHAMTGLEPAELTDRFVDAATVLPPEWLAMCRQVQDAPDDAQRLVALEDFLEPRWQACRSAGHGQVHRYTDWVTHLAQRAAVSGPGRSLRQLERRVKRWAGLPLRELRGMARSEQAFFDAVTAQVETGSIRWADIAADNGYADQSHLCRMSRRITGFSPEALRAGIEKEEPFWAYRLWM